MAPTLLRHCISTLWVANAVTRHSTFREVSTARQSLCMFPIKDPPLMEGAWSEMWTLCRGSFVPSSAFLSHRSSGWDIKEELEGALIFSLGGIRVLPGSNAASRTRRLVRYERWAASDGGCQWSSEAGAFMDQRTQWCSTARCGWLMDIYTLLGMGHVVYENVLTFPLINPH